MTSPPRPREPKLADLRLAKSNDCPTPSIAASCKNSAPTRGSPSASSHGSSDRTHLPSPSESSVCERRTADGFSREGRPRESRVGDDRDVRHPAVSRGTVSPTRGRSQTIPRDIRRLSDLGRSLFAPQGQHRFDRSPRGRARSHVRVRSDEHDLRAELALGRVNGAARSLHANDPRDRNEGASVSFGGRDRTTTSAEPRVRCGTFAPWMSTFEPCRGRKLTACSSEA